MSMFGTRRGRRVLVCSRGDCAPAERGKSIEHLLAQLIAQNGLDNPEHPQHATVTLTNCLAVCANGPILIVHPEGVKYHHVDETALNRIFYEHIIGESIVEELRAPSGLPRPFRL